MQYDPIKHSLGKVFNQTPLLRRLFYRMLDLLLLRAWHIRKELREHARSMPDTKNILDAGSGFGQYTYRMARWFPRASIHAVDIKSEQVDDCNHFMEQIHLADRTKFELADLTCFIRPGQFDLILSVDVMEHIDDDIRVFKNFHASMKKGGLLLISTPSDRGGSDSHGEGDGMHGFIDEHVRDGYNIDEIIDKLKTAGFEKTEARYSYGIPGNISWNLTMKYPILMLGITKWFYIFLPFYYLVVFPFAIVLNCLDINTKHKSGTGLIVKAWK